MELREARGISRADLADALGWSRMRLYRLEKGWTKPLAEDVPDWASALEVSVADVYGEST